MTKKSIPRDYNNMDKYDDDTINNIINDYNDGMTIIDIFIKYDISSFTLYKLLQDNNVDRNRQTKLTEEQEQEIIQMYLDNYSIKEICKKYNIYHGSIYRILDKNNITRNHQTRQCKIIDKNIINSIINDYNNSDLTVQEICYKYDLNNSTLNNMITKNNVSKRKSGPKKTYKYIDSDIINDYNNGVDIIDISVRYNISRATVYRILKRNNIKLNKNKSK